jgi:amino acid permease
VLTNVGVPKLDINNTWQRAVVIGAMSVLLTPLHLKKDLSFLRYFTLVGVFCIGLVSLIVVCQTPEYFHATPRVYTLAEFKPASLLTFFSIAVYAFICHTNLVPVIYNLQNRTRPRVKKVLLCLFLFLAIRFFFEPFGSP